MNIVKEQKKFTDKKNPLKDKVTFCYLQDWKKKYIYMKKVATQTEHDSVFHTCQASVCAAYKHSQCVKGVRLVCAVLCSGVKKKRHPVHWLQSTVCIVPVCRFRALKSRTFKRYNFILLLSLLLFYYNTTRAITSGWPSSQTHSVPHVLLHNSSAKLFSHLSLDRCPDRHCI